VGDGGCAQGDDEAARKALELEKRLREIAQRGVVKLFNAVRAAQTKGEKGGKAVKGEGVVGIEKREEKCMVSPPYMGFGIGKNSKEC